MKNICNYINEKLVISKNIKQPYTYFPKTKEELQNIIAKRIAEEGWECDLNDIDTSKISDMSELFKDMSKFNGDISNWDVSNVTNMDHMFYYCDNFNCDISEWDTSNVKSMGGMFKDCHHFNQDLSKWKTRSLTNTASMFYWCEQFDKAKELAGWDVTHIKDMHYMFTDCHMFDGNALDKWNIKSDVNTNNMFRGCLSAPSWYNK